MLFCRPRSASPVPRLQQYLWLRAYESDKAAYAGCTEVDIQVLETSVTVARGGDCLPWGEEFVHGLPAYMHGVERVIMHCRSSL